MRPVQGVVHSLNQSLMRQHLLECLTLKSKSYITIPCRLIATVTLESMDENPSIALHTHCIMMCERSMAQNCQHHRTYSADNFVP